MPVDWDVPPGCASAESFVDRVLAQADVPEPSALSIAVSVRRLPGDRWRLALALEGEAGIDRREIEGESCEAVVDAAALIVSLRLVEAAQQRDVVPPAAPVEPSPTEPAAAEPPPSSAGSPAAEPKIAVAPRPEIAFARRRTAPHGWLAASAGPALGILPGVGAGVSLDGGVQGELWRVGASVRALPVRRVTHPDRDEIEGRFDLVHGGVLGCGMPSVRRVAFPICARLDAGAIRGVGEGEGVSPNPRWSPWVGVAGSAAIAWRVTRFVAPFVGAEGVVGLVRPPFTVGGEPAPLYRAGRAGFRAWAGIEIHLRFRPKKTGPA